MNHEIVPGSWQTDEWGRRYRMVGNVKEFEMMVRVGGIEVPQSRLNEFHARNKAEAEKKQIEKKKEPSKITKICPFSMGLVDSCKPGCAFFTERGCAVAGYATDTIGKTCPFNNRICRLECSLYKDGCTITKERN